MPTGNPIRTSSNAPYVVAVVVMAFIGVSAVVAVTIIRPQEDNTMLIVAIFGSLSPTTLALLAFMKSQETHLSVNSRLDAFIQGASATARSEGIIEGQNSANMRKDELASK